MQLASPTTLKPFDPAERPGIGGPIKSTALSALDKSGVLYRQAARKDSLPATSSPVSDIPGLAKLATVADADPAANQKAAVEAQATQLVNQTFYGTMLRQMRESPFKSDLFSGGKGGDSFNQLFDQKLVEQMSRGSGKKLIEAIAKKFAKKAYGAQAGDNRKAGDQGSMLGSENGAAGANVPAQVTPELATDAPVKLATATPVLSRK